MALPEMTIKDGNGTNQTVNYHLGADGSATFVKSTDGQLATYYGAGVDFAPVATPTAYILLQGSATKTIRIRRIRATGMATAYGEMKIKLARWSTAGTAGSAVLSSAVAALKADSANDAATAVRKTVGTANYTTEGTETVASYGVLSFAPLTTAATSSDAVPWTFQAGWGGEQALVLRGTSEFLAIGGDGDALPSGGVIQYEICWTEESES
jgi:hypothetical protein